MVLYTVCTKHKNDVGKIINLGRKMNNVIDNNP